jgi:hypothetical protein
VHGEQGMYRRGRHSAADARGGLQRHRHQTLAAWERFASGEDDVQGIPPPILLSWYRCRDVHKVDPRLSRPAAVSRGRNHRLAHAGVFAQLGGIASAIVERSEQCLATVTDGDGQILASWGKGGLRHQAVDSNLAPFFTWSEAATGTNGMGTAIMQQQPVLVRGPEHWCQSLHEWTCVGVAVHDAVTQDAVAALNISSCWKDDITVFANGFAAELQPVRAGLREQALQDGIEVSRAFMKADRQSSGKLLAIDIAGNVIAANEETRAVLDDLPQGFMLDPASRWKPGVPQMRSIVTQAGENLQDNPDWVGSADIGTPLLGRSEMFSLTPVHSADDVIGWVLSSGRSRSGGEELAGRAAPPPSPGRPGRIAAFYRGQVLLLDPSEIRYAEADRHVVWLATDAGRVRAATQGMDNVDTELTPFGFLRVHRSYLVNLDRVRKLEHKGKGILTLSTDPNKDEQIPVSRRSVSRVKSLLGL